MRSCRCSGIPQCLRHGDPRFPAVSSHQGFLGLPCCSSLCLGKRLLHKAHNFSVSSPAPPPRYYRYRIASLRRDSYKVIGTDSTTEQPSKLAVHLGASLLERGSLAEYEPPPRYANDEAGVRFARPADHAGAVLDANGRPLRRARGSIGSYLGVMAGLVLFTM